MSFFWLEDFILNDKYSKKDMNSFISKILNAMIEEKFVKTKITKKEKVINLNNTFTIEIISKDTTIIDNLNIKSYISNLGINVLHNNVEWLFNI